MKQYNCVVHGMTDLEAWLSTVAIRPETRSARSILVQVFTGVQEPGWLDRLFSKIHEHLQEAVVVGMSSSGGLAHGWTWNDTTVLSLSCFDATDLVVLVEPSGPGEFRSIGHDLAARIDRVDGQIAGVLLLATPTGLDMNEMLHGLHSARVDATLFGGCAGNYRGLSQSSVFFADQVLQQGAVAVVLVSETLHILQDSCLGWQSLSREMTITHAVGNRILKVDNQPAFDVYRNYLNISGDADFFQNALEFPLLIQHESGEQARVPVAVDAQGGLQFVADIRQGQVFRIGYGNPDLIIHNAQAMQAMMEAFMPEAIFLFTGACRRLLMEEDTDLETRPLEGVAPTAGVYTTGEFCGSLKSARLLNSSLLGIGLREGLPVRRHAAVLQPSSQSALAELTDPYRHKRGRIVSRLVHFVDAVTRELAEAHTCNLELAQQKLAIERERNQEQERLLDMLNHEIKTPMSIIRLALGFDKVPDGVRKHANQAMLDLEAIVNRCLQMNQLEQSRFTPVLQDCRLDEQILEWCASLDGRNRLDLQLDVQSDVHVDPFLYRIMFMNLLDNAFKYASSDSPIRVETGLTERNSARHVRLAISNLPGAAGWPDEQQVFSKYYRSPGAHNLTGSGLGLYLVRNLAELVGGSVDYSPLEQEVRFELWIPG